MRRRLIAAGKLLLAAVLVAAVGWQFAKLLRSPDLWATAVTVHPEWLVAAGLLYLGCHTVWATFFVTLTRRIAGPLPWAAGVRGYFLSQFGKYIPGKAGAIVLRVLLLRPWGLHPVAVAATATYETLTSMAAGALVAAALLPAVTAGDDVRAKVASGLVLLAGLPVGVVVLVKLAGWLVARKGGPPLPAPPPLLLLRGLAQDALGWLLLGLSLGCTLRGLGFAAGPADYPSHLFAAAASYVVGFVVPTPGGLGTREWLLQRTLAPALDPGGAGGDAGLAAGALVAVVLRLVWTVAEVVSAPLLYWLLPAAPAIPTATPSESGPDDAPAP